jgi:hypothetical protein
VVHSFINVEAERPFQNEILGPPLCRICERSATGPLPPYAPAPASLGLFVLRAAKVLGWWWHGLGRPNPFFDDRTGTPLSAPRVLTRADQPLKCPSAQPGMGDVQVLGVISRDAEQPTLSYLDEPVAPIEEILELAARLPISHVFRLSARCEESKCTHFDGTRCQLAVRIARMLPEAVDSLPKCTPMVSSGGTRRLPALPADRHRHI